MHCRIRTFLRLAPNYYTRLQKLTDTPNKCNSDKAEKTEGDKMEKMRVLLPESCERSKCVPATDCESAGYTCRFNYHPEIEVLINNQIRVEQQAAQDYLSFAVHFAHPNKSRPGCYNYFMNMFEEELGHMWALVQYQLTRGGVVVLGSVDPPPVCENLNMLSAFRRTLCMEHQVTEKLNEIVTQANAANDFKTSDYIASVFLDEQMRSITEISSHITRVTRICESESALTRYDDTLFQKYPYSSRFKE